MSDLNILVKELVSKIDKPKFIYNDFSTFDKEKSYIFIQVRFGSNDEVEMAVKTFLGGKWLSSGENVHKFERRFGKMFNTKHSLMVNSSSANLVMVGALKKILKWKDGDEIIVSPVGFPTTIRSNSTTWFETCIH